MILLIACWTLFTYHCVGDKLEAGAFKVLLLWPNFVESKKVPNKNLACAIHFRTLLTLAYNPKFKYVSN